MNLFRKTDNQKIYSQDKFRTVNLQTGFLAALVLVGRLVLDFFLAQLCKAKPY